jgi:hypothetical protein
MINIQNCGGYMKMQLHMRLVFTGIRPALSHNRNPSYVFFLGLSEGQS